MKIFTKNQAISLVATVAISLAGLGNAAKASAPPADNGASDFNATCTAQEDAALARKVNPLKNQLASLQAKEKRTTSEEFQMTRLNDQIAQLESAEQDKIDSCVKQKNAQLNSDLNGDCGHSNVFTGLKGTNCQTAADAVQNNKTRQQAVDSAALATTTVASTLAANQAAQDSSNNAAQSAQKTMLQTTAITKMVQAAEQAYSASQLSSAASGASAASKALKAQADDEGLRQQCLLSKTDTECNATLTGLANRNLTFEQYFHFGLGWWRFDQAPSAQEEPRT